MTRVLVTGSSGFIGTNLVEHYLRLGDEVCAGDALEAVGIHRFPMSTRRLQNMMTGAVYDTRPIHHVAGPDPYSLQAAVALTCEWLVGQRAAA